MRLTVPKSQLATRARQHDANTKLLVIHSQSKRYEHALFESLARYLKEGDLLVVNDAATIPASFRGTLKGQELELRLAACLEPNEKQPQRWLAVVFGRGSWRVPTENRGAPAVAFAGDLIDLGAGLRAQVEKVRPESNRLLEIGWRCDLRELWRLLYLNGRPIQYSYLKEELRLWDTQTLFATHPASVESPSAAFPLTWSQLFDLNSRGVKLAPLTHAAGLSSTGDAELDRLLPFDEHYSIPQETAAAVNEAMERGNKVIAVGTTVARALESAASLGTVRAGSATTGLKITSRYQRRVVSGLITGLHEPGASHLDLLSAFAPSSAIEAAYASALANGYLWHEYGDACLIL